jgi:hypothetical protein
MSLLSVGLIIATVINIAAAVLNAFCIRSYLKRIAMAREAERQYKIALEAIAKR